MASNPVVLRPAASETPSGRRPRASMALLVEVTLAAGVVLLDLLIPSLVLLAMAALSLHARHQAIRDLGMVRPDGLARLVGQVLCLSLVWTAIVIGVTIPVLEHITGKRQDVTQFADIEGHVGLLLVMLVFGWTLGALAEELAYRGYLQTRLRELLPGAGISVVGAVLLSSVFFGLAHGEQGAIGVAVTTLDAVFFSIVRYCYRTLWASVFAHGFINTIGLTAFYFVGPIYGLW